MQRILQKTLVFGGKICKNAPDCSENKAVLGRFLGTFDAFPLEF